MRKAKKGSSCSLPRADIRTRDRVVISLAMLKRERGSSCNLPRTAEQTRAKRDRVVISLEPLNGPGQERDRVVISLEPLKEPGQKAGSSCNLL